MPEPTIWELLKTDHEAIRSLFDQMRAAEPMLARTLLPRLVFELTAHARAKEAVFYGHFLHDERARARVLEGLEDHKRIQTALAELELLPVDDDKWPHRLAALVDVVTEHFRIEEVELFALARQSLSPTQASDLAAQFAAERARIKGDLSRLGDAR